MSYILDALRRAEAERERKRGAAAPSVLHEPPPAALPETRAPSAARPALPPAAWVAGGVALALAAVAAWVATRGPAEADGTVQLAEGGAAPGTVTHPGTGSGSGTPAPSGLAEPPQGLARAPHDGLPGGARAIPAPDEGRQPPGPAAVTELPTPSIAPPAPAVAPPAVRPPASPAPLAPATTPAEAVPRGAAPPADPATTMGGGMPAQAPRAAGALAAPRPATGTGTGTGTGALTAAPAAAASPQAARPGPDRPAGPATRGSSGPSTGPSTSTTASLPPLPEALQRQFAISGSRYADDPAQRLLIVNGLVVREGGALAPGLTLERINLRTAVISHQGQRYELRY